MCDQDKTPAKTTTEVTASRAFDAYRREHPVRFYVTSVIGNIVAVFRKRP